MIKTNNINIVPAIDLIDGQCVRLTQGDYGQKTVYSSSPVEIAKSFEAIGITRLHLVDLDGAKAKKIVNHAVLEQIATATQLKIDFGGGIKSEESIRIAFESGASQITAGSIAVKDPDLVDQWLETYGAERIILGADVKGQRIAINGWQEESQQDLFPFLSYYLKQGGQQCICTDVAKDGLLQGPSFELYEQILDTFPSIKLVASGGVTSLEDIIQLAEMGCSEVIVGKALYEGKISLEDLKSFLLTC